MANITKAEATDDTTLVLTVDKPSPIMEHLAVYILPEHIWKDIDGKEVRSYENEPTDGQPIVGAGPYVLIERQKGQFIRFQANPNYYGGAPAVDELTFRVYKNADAVAQALRKGEIDFADEHAGQRLRRDQGRAGHHRGHRRLLRLQRDRDEHRARPWPTAPPSATATRR